MREKSKAFNIQDLRYFGSEGEQRTAALALRLAEWEQIYSRSEGEKPLLLLDDIGYGLDAQRQKRLLDWLKRAGQVFVTTTHAEGLVGHGVAAHEF